MQVNQDVSNKDSYQDCESCAFKASCFINVFDIKKYQPFKKTHTLKYGEVLLRLDQPLKNLYVVKSGALKSSMNKVKGDEYIANFALAGEMVGLESLNTRRSIVTTVALTSTELCSFQLDIFFAELAKNPKLSASLSELLATKVSMDALSYFYRSGSALERVKYFLRDMAERIHQSDQQFPSLKLSMSRQEIASYLNLKTETVSRSLSKLHTLGVYRIKKREIYLISN